MLCGDEEQRTDGEVPLTIQPKSFVLEGEQLAGTEEPPATLGKLKSFNF